jgi:hypothetical protein
MTYVNLVVDFTIFLLNLNLQINHGPMHISILQYGKVPTIIISPLALVSTANIDTFAS